MSKWIQSALIAAATVVLLSPAACTMHRQMIISRAMDGGADPIKTKCALEHLSGMADLAVCMAAAGK